MAPGPPGAGATALKSVLAPRDKRLLMPLDKLFSLPVFSSSLKSTSWLENRSMMTGRNTYGWCGVDGGVGGGGMTRLETCGSAKECAYLLHIVWQCLYNRGCLGLLARNCHRDGKRGICLDPIHRWGAHQLHLILLLKQLGVASTGATTQLQGNGQIAPERVCICGECVCGNSDSQPCGWWCTLKQYLQTPHKNTP